MKRTGSTLSPVKAPPPATKLKGESGSLYRFSQALVALKAGEALPMPSMGKKGGVATTYAACLKAATAFSGKDYRSYRATDGKFYVRND